MKKHLITLFFLLIVINFVSSAEGDYLGSFDIGLVNNNNSYGITQNGTYIWIVDDPAEVFKYYINGTAISSFAIGGGVNDNDDPRGISQNGTYFWISDDLNDQVYQYWINGTWTGNSFDTAVTGNTFPRGLDQNSSHIFITDGTDDGLYTYLINGTYISFSYFIGSNNNDSYGITQNGVYFWVTDGTDDEVYKYWMNGSYTGSSFDTSIALNGQPQGITQNETHFLITDAADEEVYIYSMVSSSGSSILNISVYDSLIISDFADKQNTFFRNSDNVFAVSDTAQKNLNTIVNSQDSLVINLIVKKNIFISDIISSRLDLISNIFSSIPSISIGTPSGGKGYSNVIQNVTSEMDNKISLNQRMLDLNKNILLIAILFLVFISIIAFSYYMWFSSKTKIHLIHRVILWIINSLMIVTLIAIVIYLYYTL